MTCCAICVSDKGPFTSQPIGRDNAIVKVCFACDQPVFTRTGLERGYQGGAGPSAPNREAMTVSMRRMMGDERYEQLTKLDEECGRMTTPAMSDDDREDMLYQLESKRIIETRRNTWAPNGRRLK